MTTPVFPLNRVADVLRRMDDNSSQSEAMKTCFGILAIMSREDVNKVLIARDGMETILNVMTQHVDKTDVQESGCDLLWSLAFNNAAVKDTIAKNGGASVLVRALKRHCKSSEFLKSACGALSNMCQSKLNQEGVASQGGLQPLVGSIHIHQNNAKLLPFIFDALASLIVSNEENARIVSSLGIVPLIVSSLGRHKAATEVVKSGCHALAILSDVKGQASKIAFAGGVPVILSLLDVHPSYSDLHRVAAVVLLRMLQESAHVGREITSSEGVRVLLKSLEKGGAQHDTVAAVTHILFTVTNPSSPSSSNIESQLWICARSEDTETAGGDAALTTDSKGKTRLMAKVADSRHGGASSHDTAYSPLGVLQLTRQSEAALAANKDKDASKDGTQTALAGLVLILGQYQDRRDVVRAACRLLNNLGGFPGVVAALEKLNALDRVIECAATHGETRDVVDSATALLKAIHKRGVPSISSPSSTCFHGIVHILKMKQHDEDASIAAIETLNKMLESGTGTAQAVGTGAGAGGKPAIVKAGPLTPSLIATSSSAASDDKTDRRVWEQEALTNCTNILTKLAADDSIDDGRNSPTGRNSPALQSKSQAQKRSVWTRHTPRLIDAILKLIELVCAKGNSVETRNQVPAIYAEIHSALIQLQDSRDVELGRRIERVLPLLSSKKTPAQEKREEEAKAAVSEAQSVGVLWGNKSGSDKDPGLSSSKHNSATNAEPVKAKTYPMYVISSTGQAIPKVWNEAEEESSNGTRQLLPLHPSKYFQRQPGLLAHEVPRLLETWPTYLERLVISPNSLISRSFQSTLSSGTGERIHICYEGAYAGGKTLVSRCATPVPYSVPSGGIGQPYEHSLSFDSEFESGNLLRAVQKGDAAYDLFLRSDLHTGGHTQWFYFAVSNTHPAALVRLAEQGVQVPPVRTRFNIVNLTKPDSLFNLGMRPVVYSCLDAAVKGTGWMRAGSDISYNANQYMRSNTQGEGMNNYYTLSFTIEFHHPKDTVLIAYSYPYTCGDYHAHLSRIMSRPGSGDRIRQSRLCLTLGGEECDLLVITNFKDKDRIGPMTYAQMEAWKLESTAALVPTGRDRREAQAKAAAAAQKPLKPALFISCRVHPGETPASWMMKGMLDFLTSDCTQALLLRNAFVIYVVPMLNPDGVIYGNNRCSLAGVDLNRQWKIPMKGLHPTVHSLKTFMAAQRRIREVLMYIDLHGHSRKYNVFMYGCDDKKRPKPQVRSFPRFFSMHHVGKKYVCYSDCSFHVKKGREATARVVVARELNIPCSFTLEATFCGSNYGPLKHCHMNLGHMQEVGAALCDAILNFSISEGKIADALMVPANVRAVAQVEAAIALEDGAAVVGMGQTLVSANGEALRIAAQSDKHAATDVFPHAKESGLGGFSDKADEEEEEINSRPASQSQQMSQWAMKEDDDVDSGSDDGVVGESDSDTHSNHGQGQTPLQGGSGDISSANGMHSMSMQSISSASSAGARNAAANGNSGIGFLSARDSGGDLAAAGVGAMNISATGHAAFKRSIPISQHKSSLLSSTMPQLPANGANAKGALGFMNAPTAGSAATLDSRGLLPMPPSGGPSALVRVSQSNSSTSYRLLVAGARDDLTVPSMLGVHNGVYGSTSAAERRSAPDSGSTALKSGTSKKKKGSTTRVRKVSPLK